MNCRDAAEAVSRSLDAPLSRADQVGLEIHILCCGHCRRYRRQLTQLHAECEALAGDLAPDESVRLSPAARARIAAALDPPGGS